MLAVWNRFVGANPLVWMFGLGFRQTAFVNQETLGWVTAHNSYVSMLAEIGVVGLGLLTWMWARTLRLAVRGRAWWIAGGCSALLAHFMTEGFLYGYQYVFLMTLLSASADAETATDNSVAYYDGAQLV